MTNEEVKSTLLDHFNWCGICEDETCEACYVTAIKIAVESIEKQIPKKPKLNFYDRWICCPVCEEVLSDEEGLPLGDIDIIYCWRCGQAIDWSKKCEKQ